MLMYYVPTVAGGWKTFGKQYDSFWCCTGTGSEEYAKLVDTLYFHDDSSVYVNQFVASEVSWPEKHARLVQETSFPEQERTAITIHAEKPVEFTLRVRAPHWAQGSVNAQPNRKHLSRGLFSRSGPAARRKGRRRDGCRRSTSTSGRSRSGYP